jgi:Ig-like domain from next to BRCA1 gene
MNTKKTLIGTGLPVIALAGILLLSACGGNSTPTLTVDEIYTAAFQTFSAQAATQEGLQPPTLTELPSPFPTLPLAPTQSIFPTTVVTSPTSGVAAGCNNSVWISDVTVADGTVLSPGTAFVKTWLVQNNGTCAWNTNYKLLFAFGSVMNGTTVSIPQAVAPGGQVQISVNLIAPTGAGNYTGNWRMQNDQSQFFGTILTVVINVPTATGTSTPAPNTPTPSHTPNPTSTTAPTSTP